ncbi:PIG-L deacetylase family protein [Conexibacter arvalis]|uniref:LmbE family N-acetylglucosaminyl deacetylase n=1 Tax=Conexibacter arvalis TaxID=912552 RepID=A0A840IEH7_9ACTN|nr:PIG-L family deacetylase [Conexibacter arvalis]MBB4662418.1 LmbE family N-acetylglucosaminyl deacetylase [Conexibacter arvalis]
MTTSIVCVGAHQDDVELHCLGTLLAWRARGDVEITTVTVTNGDKGGQHDLSLSHARVAEIRTAEAAAVAERLGGRYVCLDAPDELLEDTPDLRLALTDVLRAARADVVYAPPPVDYNVDHTVTSQLAHHACLLAPVRTIATDHEPLARAPQLFYTDAITGLEWQPTTYVDISPHFERKLELLELHESQMANMDQFGGWDLRRYAEVVGAFRGLQCGVAYAEAFAPALAWPRLRPGPLPGA